MSYVKVSNIVKVRIGDVFDYLSDATHYSELVPKSLKLAIVGTPVKMNQGAEYELKATRYGVSQMLCMVIEEFDYPHQLTITQTIGIFKKWSLTIHIEDHSAEECLIQFLLNYELPFGLVGRLYDDLYMRRFLRGMLDHASKMIPKKIKS